jgi:hypothetical protein
MRISGIALFALTILLDAAYGGEIVEAKDRLS